MIDFLKLWFQAIFPIWVDSETDPGSQCRDYDRPRPPCPSRGDFPGFSPPQSRIMGSDRSKYRPTRPSGVAHIPTALTPSRCQTLALLATDQRFRLRITHPLLLRVPLDLPSQPRRDAG